MFKNFFAVIGAWMVLIFFVLSMSNSLHKILYIGPNKNMFIVKEFQNVVNECKNKKIIGDKNGADECAIIENFIVENNQKKGN